MISPLKIHIVVVHQIIQDFVRVGTSVKNITDDVQLVHGQSAYCLSQLYYVLLSHSALYHRIYNLSVVICSVGIVISVQQLVHTVIHVLWQSVTNP